MAEKRFIKIKNISNSRVIYTVPTTGIRRVYTPGTTLLIPLEEFEQTVFDTSVRTLFEEGFLRVLDTDTALEVGLESVPDAEVPTSGDVKPASVALSSDEIRKTFTSGDKAAIVRMCKSATPETKQQIIQVATADKLTDQATVKILKDHFNFDILESVRLQS